MDAIVLVTMVMRSAIKSAQGSTLVEMMVASAIGVIVIGTIGSVFITNQRLSSEKSLELLLSQEPVLHDSNDERRDLACWI